VYDPSRFEPSSPDRQEDVKRLDHENGMLREKLLHLEEDYCSLQEKRLQDVSVVVLL
jgi:predicted nuclease with TOPRIM domain